MKIAIIGSGAIGSLVAGYLKNKGVDVILIGRPQAVSKIRADSLTIKGIRGEFHIKIDIFEKLNQKVDLVILAVKTQDIEEALKINSPYLKNTPVLLTQNGLGAEEIACRFLPQENILSSVVMFGATSLSPGEVIHNFEGDWILGSFFGFSKDILKRIKEVLEKSFSVVISDDIRGMKWTKLFLNANNCIPAILNRSMQEVFSNIEVCKVAIGIWKELWGLVRKAKIRLESLPGFEVERIERLVSLDIEESAKIFSQIMQNLSKEPLYGSILQSIKKGKNTEIDYINGAIVKAGKEYNYHTPLNRRLVELVHQAERGNFLTPEEFLFKTLNLIPRSGNLNTPFPQLKLTVVKVEGDCYHGYKQGDEIILEDFTHPPRYFCLGLAHALFPVIYALSFGAHFPFMNNQRSLFVTCPDGGKLEFKVEVLDKEGNAEFIPRHREYKGPDPKDMEIEVIRSKGSCPYGYKVGDKFEVKGLKCIEGFCGAAWHTLFPALFALNFGAKFFFMDDPDTIDTVTCPDGGKIIFKVRRKDKKNEDQKGRL